MTRLEHALHQGTSHVECSSCFYSVDEPSNVRSDSDLKVATNKKIVQYITASLRPRWSLKVRPSVLEKVLELALVPNLLGRKIRIAILMLKPGCILLNCIDGAGFTSPGLSSGEKTMRVDYAFGSFGFRQERLLLEKELVRSCPWIALKSPLRIQCG